MTGPAKRWTCRTCPSVISEHGDSGQCRPCQSRSQTVREAVRREPTVTPRERTCEQDGHHACEHFQALYGYVKGFAGDCDWCPVCGVEAETDDGIQHKQECALFAILNAETSATRAEGQTDG
jgi:hypothetical protein